MHALYPKKFSSLHKRFCPLKSFISNSALWLTNTEGIRCMLIKCKQEMPYVHYHCYTQCHNEINALTTLQYINCTLHGRIRQHVLFYFIKKLKCNIQDIKCTVYEK